MTVTEFEIKIKLWKAQVMVDNFMHFDTLVKHSPMNSKKYAPVLSVLIKEFENGFQECQKNDCFFQNICESNVA